MYLNYQDLVWFDGIWSEIEKNSFDKSLYSTIFLMIKQHNFTLYDIENMIPWEKEIYTQLITKFINSTNK